MEELGRLPSTCLDERSVIWDPQQGMSESTHGRYVASLMPLVGKALCASILDTHEELLATPAPHPLAVEVAAHGSAAKAKSADHVGHESVVAALKRFLLFEPPPLESGSEAGLLSPSSVLVLFAESGGGKTSALCTAALSAATAPTGSSTTLILRLLGTTGKSGSARAPAQLRVRPAFDPSV